MRGDEEGGAAVGGEGVEELPQVAAEDGVQADGGLVEDEEFRGAEQGHREGDPAALAAGEVAGEGVGAGGEADVLDDAGDGLAAAGAGGPAGVQDGGEVVEVLADGEVVVYGRVLGHIADAGAQPGVARGVAEDVEGAGDLGLGADDGAHQGGFAAAGGAEEAGDAAAGHVEGEGVEDGAAASGDGEVVGVDGGIIGITAIIHHAMNNAPGGVGRQPSGRDGSGRSE